MCWKIRNLLMLWVALAASPTFAQSNMAPASAPLPTPAGYENAAAPSEPWQPPASVTGNTSDGPQPAELPVPNTAEPATDSAKGIVVEQESHWYSPILWLGPAPWDSGIELGLNGSSGTSDSLSIRTGAFIKRESRFSKLDFSTYYNLTMNGGESTQDNAQLDVTHDWLIHESSPWTLFAAVDLFHDKFASFELQTNLNTGVGYRFVHTPELELMTRLGGGASREFGGPNDRWVPESLVGFEYCQRVTQTQKFYSKLDYYPEWDQVGEFRMVADTGWEIELVQPSNLSLKISATDRYDSTPDGVNPHLVNYSVLLLLKL
jgi:putative salt-induced outer membrane protein YdiY